MEDIKLKEGKNFIFLGQIDEENEYIEDLKYDLIEECIKINSPMFLVDNGGIYCCYSDTSNLKFKICKNLDDINELADFISKLEFDERTYLFISDYNKSIISNVKLMNIINSKKDNLRVVVFCDYPSKLKKKDVSSFDYAMQLDFCNQYSNLFDEPLMDFSDYVGDCYPAIYDIKKLEHCTKCPPFNPFILMDLILYNGKLFDNNLDIEKLFPGFYKYFDSSLTPNSIHYLELLHYKYPFAENYSINLLFEEEIKDYYDNPTMYFKQFNYYNIVCNVDGRDVAKYFREYLLLERENLYKFFDFYYRFAKKIYKRINSSHNFRRSLLYLDVLSYEVLCACSKYYYSIGDIKRGNLMLYLCLYAFVGENRYATTLYCLHHNNYENGFGERIFRILNDFKENLSSIKDYIYNDWCIMCPRITYFIGKYYLSINDKKEAFSWFSIGSNLNYEGRKSYTPFNEVARNMYEKLLLLLENNDYEGCEKLLKSFPLRRFRPLPIEANIIPYNINQNNFEEVEDYKFECYSNFYSTFSDKHQYFGFQYLDEKQKEEFERILNKKISQANNDAKLLEKLEGLKHRLTDDDWVKIWL